SSIKDVARVLDLPLNDSNKLANLVPSKADVKLKDILELPLDNVEEKYQKLNKNKTESDIKTKSTNLVDSKKYNAAQIDNIKELRRYLADKNSLESKVLSKAKELEGSIRNTGVHASAIIIAPKDLTDLIPICISKNTDLFVTQIEGDDIEKSGVIKMDFLGLATLTIIKKALEIIAQVDNIDIDMDKISLTDDKTFKLFQQGDTIGIFQFESEGMQKYLKQMKPDCIDDLVALIALYRPGPMKYIDTYIRRKFGIEKIDYYLPEMKEYLEETLGIFVFQEQVMLMSQKLAGFSKSESDYLRKAMGKKNVKLMEEMRLKFFTKMTEKGYDEIVCNKIWDDWKDFAEYAFNKSHSVAYTFLSYQTGFLKANYREAYLAALLNNAGNAEKIRVFLDDCKKNNIKVLGPDINESDIGFTVNKQKQIRFGLGGIKGLGINTIQDILDERKLHGNFSNLFNLFERLANKTLNKKSIECLVYSGSIDSISEYSRATILNKKDDASKANYEKLLDFVLQKSKLEIENSNSLFSNFTEEVAVKKPEIIACPDWHKLKQINYEKDYTGMYFTGHPLDDYFFELNQLNFTPLNIFNLKKPVTSFNDNTKENADQNNVIDSEEQPEEDIVKFNLNEKIRIGGMITMQQPKISKNGKHYLVFDIEDFTSKTSFTLFSNDYVKYKNFIEGNFKIFIEGSFEFSNFLNRIEFKITKIDLLENIMLQVKGITLKLTPDMVTSEFIHEWETCLSNCKSGSISLRFVIEDFKQGVDIKLLHSKKVSIHEEFKLNIYNKYPQNFEIFL
ncbi:MAG: DNA polymerase III subunit alpha, partial [Alphaproteobacteria bacterium]|nr:DNA polymerase III subunit alpha [Alphaproteobacteria bacterium]